MKVTLKGLLKLVLIIALISIAFPFIIKAMENWTYMARVLSRYDIYSGFNTNINGKIYSFILSMLLPYCVYRFNQKYQITNIFDNLMFNYFTIALLTILFSGFGRLQNFFTPFIAVYAANTIGDLFKYTKFRQVKYILVFLIMALPLYNKMSYYLYSTNEAYPNTNRLNAWYPYSSVLDKEEFSYREPIYYWLLYRE